MTRNDTVEYSVSTSSLFFFHWNYVCISYRFSHTQCKKCSDLETRGMSRSRTLKKATFDRSHTTFCCWAIVSIARCCTIFAVIGRLIILTLKYGLCNNEGHSKFYHSKLGCGFKFAFHSNYCSISHQFWHKARYWSQIVMFCTPSGVRRTR